MAVTSWRPVTLRPALCAPGCAAGPGVSRPGPAALAASRAPGGGISAARLPVRAGSHLTPARTLLGVVVVVGHVVLRVMPGVRFRRLQLVAADRDWGRPLAEPAGDVLGGRGDAVHRGPAVELGDTRPCAVVHAVALEAPDGRTH